MMMMMYRRLLFQVMLLGGVLPAAEPGREITALGSPDVAVRRAAVEAIQTMNDPRVPEACLPLLRDEGRSIRRQAARAIGSRFADIPVERRGAYLEALKKCAAEGPEDTALMCQRAIGLLTELYDAPYFSVGPHRKWVLYERHKLPVVGQVKGGPHLLLSPVMPGGNEKADLLTLAITNETATTLFSPHWHPGGEAVAFTPVTQRKFFTPVCIWVAGENEVKVLEPKSLKPFLPKRYPAWGTTSEFVRWDGTKAIVRIYDCDRPDSSGPVDDPGVFISYDIRTKQTAAESGKR